MRRGLLLLLSLAGSLLSASNFQDYQAARAVIGQPSFSAREKGVTGRALSLSQTSLYVADTSGRVLTFESLPHRIGENTCVSGMYHCSAIQHPANRFRGGRCRGRQRPKRCHRGRKVSSSDALERRLTS